jgi:AcrR family transcriptional regulator
LSETRADGRSRRSETTRRALVTAARTLFAEHGYAAVSTGDIARAAGVTRNALYYHFPNKESLFRAVYNDVEQELAARVVPAALAESSPRRQLEVGCAVFLDGCMDPGVTRCVLEAPGVLGFQQMREIASEHYLAVMREGLRIAIEAGDLPNIPIETLASMLIGALDEAALLIGTAENPKQARREAGEVTQALIAGLFSSTT